MASKTFHISFPLDWAKEIEKEMKREHYTPSEYFKALYRRFREERQVMADLEESEEDLRKGRTVEAKSLKDL